MSSIRLAGAQETGRRNAMAVSVWAIALAMGAAAISITLLSGSDHGVVWDDVIVATTFPTIGMLIVIRADSNPVGWLFLASGFMSQLNVLSTVYSYDAFVLGNSRPLAALAAWVSAWSWIPSLAIVMFFLPLLFPTGDFLTDGWRRVGAGAGILTVSAVTLIALLPFDITQAKYRHVTNPIGIDFLESQLPVIGVIIVIAAMAALVCSVSSLVVRFRRSSGDERQQMKLFVYSVCVFAVLIVVATVTNHDWLTTVGVVFVTVSPCVAILRYRLYDIDRIINRTLVYALVTGVLAGAYLLLVLLLQLILPFGSRSPALVATSTLAVAAAFRPLRRRIQDFIDRSFNRARYDAQIVIEDFGSQLRHAVDLELLDLELRRAADKTMQPQAVTLWLREPNA